MDEKLADELLRAADVLHWLQKYSIANALILLARLSQVKGINTLEDLEQYVVQEESKQ